MENLKKLKQDLRYSINKDIEKTKRIQPLSKKGMRIIKKSLEENNFEFFLFEQLLNSFFGFLFVMAVFLYVLVCVLAPWGFLLMGKIEEFKGGVDLSIFSIVGFYCFIYLLLNMSLRYNYYDEDIFENEVFSEKTNFKLTQLLEYAVENNIKISNYSNLMDFFRGELWLLNEKDKEIALYRIKKLKSKEYKKDNK